MRSAGVVWMLLGEERLADWGSAWFWLFAAVILVGGVVESLRNIALSTTVTLLVPEDGRDKANGLVGTVQGIAFMITSVFSGLSVGLLGMGWTLAISIAHDRRHRCSTWCRSRSPSSTPSRRRARRAST